MAGRAARGGPLFVINICQVFLLRYAMLDSVQNASVLQAASSAAALFLTRARARAKPLCVSIGPYIANTRPPAQRQLHCPGIGTTRR